jgi:hypothetical protein
MVDLLFAKREPLIRRGTAIRVALKILFPSAKIQLFSKLATKNENRI